MSNCGGSPQEWSGISITIIIKKQAHSVDQMVFRGALDEAGAAAGAACGEHHLPPFV